MQAACHNSLSKQNFLLHGYLEKAKHNQIRRLTQREALQRILAQTIFKFPDRDKLNKLLDLVQMLLDEVPVYELENLPVPDAARLSYETMRNGAEGMKT